MSYWRNAGLNYVQYSAICARIVRRCLKGDAKAEAEKRGIVLIRPTYWKDGKQVKKQA